MRETQRLASSTLSSIGNLQTDLSSVSGMVENASRRIPIAFEQCIDRGLGQYTQYIDTRLCQILTQHYLSYQDSMDVRPEP